MKFSITIPAFKGKYLKECINSIISQSEKDIELIIVNDASPEDLDSIISEFSDSRIKYFKNDSNIGAVNIVDNWNKCLSYATGDYLICMGDDDILLPNCIEDYSNLIKKYPGLGIYHTWSQIINEKSEFVNITASRIEYESVYSLLWHRWDNRKQQYIGDFLFEVDLLRKNGGFYKLPLAWASDDISAIIAASFKGIANTQRIGFCYRVNSLSISRVGSADIKMKAILKEKKWYDDFLKDEPRNVMDLLFWKSIIRIKEKYFEKKKGLTIASDLKIHSLFRVFFWVRRFKKYELTYKILVYSIIQSRK